MSTYTNLNALAAEYDMQPYEVAAALDLGVVEDHTADDISADFAREVLDLMAEQARDTR